MSKTRSPNYPAISLKEAIEAVEPIFKKDGRNKMSRLTVVKHLGYNSLNGRSLGRLGALRAYGLLDGSGDELRLSDDAIALLQAPPGSQERETALARAFNRPPLFKEVTEHFEGRRPSEENLRWWLIQNKFTDSAANKAGSIYLDSYKLTSSTLQEYKSSATGPVTADKPPPPSAVGVGDFVQWEAQGVLQFEKPRRVRAVSRDRRWVFVEGSDTGVPMAEVELRDKTGSTGSQSAMDGVLESPTLLEEKEFFRSRLSSHSEFRLLVSGDFGPKELGKVIRLLTLQKQLMSDDETGEDRVSGWRGATPQISNPG